MITYGTEYLQAITIKNKKLKYFTLEVLVRDNIFTVDTYGLRVVGIFHAVILLIYTRFTSWFILTTTWTAAVLLTDWHRTSPSERMCGP